MAYKDLREWISTLEKEGLLSRIKCEVDWDGEIGAISREALNQKGPALLFENIKDHTGTWCSKIFVNGMGSRERVALALGLPRDTHFRDITRVARERLRTPSEVKVVDTGPVKENILRGDDVDLYQIPVPRWRKGDGGRYINTYASVVTRDPETGLMNTGTYRGMITEKNKIGVLLAMTQHWGHHFKKYSDMGKEMPVAVFYGWDPTMLMLSGSALIHPNCSEYEFCSSLRQEQCELVKCETSDLMVPASAEIVVEGFISPDPSTFMPEGPFGEYTGYFAGQARPKHTIRVECITHRDNPIFRGNIEGTSPHKWAESTFYGDPMFSACAWKLLDDVGVPGVRDVWFHNVTSGTILKIRIKKAYRGHAKQVANALWGSGIGNYAAKVVIVVDDDIDIHDSEEVEWAISYRLNAAMDQLLVFPGTFGSMLDPSTPLEQRNIIKYGQGKWARILVDATINWELEPQEQYSGGRFPPLATDVAPEDEKRVKSRWKDYGILPVDKEIEGLVYKN
jgi:4-hydroxy-3-polyprenylbenzoate decarboxylase